MYHTGISFPSLLVIETPKIFSLRNTFQVVEKGTVTEVGKGTPSHQTNSSLRPSFLRSIIAAL